MTREEFRAWARALGTSQQHARVYQEMAQKSELHDPKLAKLFLKVSEGLKEITTYLNKRAEK